MVAVTPGRVFQLSLWLYSYGSNSWTFNVLQDGVQLMGESDVAALYYEWGQYCVQFTSDGSGSTTLQFSGNSDGDSILLDDIAIQELPLGTVASTGVIPCYPSSSSSSSSSSGGSSSSSLSSSSAATSSSSSPRSSSSSHTGTSTGSSSPSSSAASSSSSSTSSSGSSSQLPSSASSSSNPLSLSSSSSWTAVCTPPALSAYPADSLSMCLQVLVLTYPVASNFTAGLTDDISASLAASYTLPSDAFVTSILLSQPETASAPARRLLSVAVEVPMVVLGNVSDAVNVTGISAASLLSLFIAQLANHTFVSNSTGAVILSQAVTAIGWPSSSSSTGEQQRTMMEDDDSDLSAGQIAGIIVAVLVATCFVTAVYICVYRRGRSDEAENDSAHARMDSKYGGGDRAAADGGVVPAVYRNEGEEGETGMDAIVP